MKQNIGNTDKTLRLLLAFVILTVGLSNNRPWAMLGMIPLVSGILAFSPLYAVLGINTLDETNVNTKI